MAKLSYGMGVKNKEIFEKSQNVAELKEVASDEEVGNIYSDEDYFSRGPKIVDKIERELIKVDSPPPSPSQDEIPAILAMGTSLSMSVMMMITGITAIEGLISGSAATRQSIISLISAGAMLTGMITFPTITRLFQKRQKKKFELKRQVRYRKYINSKIIHVNEIMDKQNIVLNQNFPINTECESIILEKSPRLWERKIEDENFLTVRLGTGELPVNADFRYPEEGFRMDDDDLIDIVNEINKKSKILENAPITISLTKKNIAALICNQQNRFDYLKNIILQLVALHNYVDLKLVFFVKEDDYEKWNFVRMLPHVWDNSKTIRFFARDNSDINDISNYLEQDFERRYVRANQTDYKNYSPYYLIITDDYRKVENIKIVSETLACKKNMGFSLLCISDNYTSLPSECQTYIDVQNEECKILVTEDASTSESNFVLDENINSDFNRISTVLSNIPIRFNVVGNEALPTKYNFLEMYDVGRIEQLNIPDRWANNDTINSLKAEVGSDGSSKPVVLDIHEKYHGPHGLIAGSTGSGKSEFIITYILSLAINYHPDYVNFVLIDYKGGGLAGAFKKKDYKLPHLVGVITNIDTNGLERSLSSIQSELRRRQIQFNKAREMADESTIDIYKYQKLYRDGVVKTPVSHLFIICDEFAELKQQQPDFMDELISVARIGRSLGVHLILATQKPAGIVNEQIRSNSKFGVCLKVQDKTDSVDVIKRPDAAFLKLAGQFYMNVGNGDYFVLGQTAWSGAPYVPTEIAKKEVDTSIDVIGDNGLIIKKYNNPKKVVNQKDLGDQLTNIVQYIHEIAVQENIDKGQLWLDEIPETIYLRNLKKKYKVTNQKDVINPVIGEYDDPENQAQGVVRLNFTENGNTIIYGSADSGKDILLSTLIFDLITTHSSEEIQIYVMDFGAETLKKFKPSPQVGDVVLINDKEKIDRMLALIEAEIRKRKEILSEYNGDYNFYVKNSQNSMPMKLIIINNFAVFSDNFMQYEEKIQAITRDCMKCGIVFLITANSFNEVRYRLQQNFKQKLCLQLFKDDDYTYVYEKVGKKRPSKLKGRGLIQMDNRIFEFQTAQIYDSSKLNDYISEIINRLNQIDKVRASTIPVMPNVVTFDDVRHALLGTQNIPIGVAAANLKIAGVDFTRNHINIITGKLSENVFEYAKSIILEINALEDEENIIFDMENIVEKSNGFNKKINNMIKSVENENGETEVYEPKLCVIVGIDKFISKLKASEYEFYDFVKILEKKYSFIVIDNATKIKAYQYDVWYKNYVTGDTGIWVGNGIDSQFTITTNATKKELVSNCGSSFGFYINQGRVTMIKLIGISEEEKNE